MMEDEQMTTAQSHPCASFPHERSDSAGQEGLLGGFHITASAMKCSDEEGSNTPMCVIPS